jgi:hypothetical protein
MYDYFKMHNIVLVWWGAFMVHREKFKNLKHGTGQYLLCLRKQYEELMFGNVPSEYLGDYSELVEFFLFVESEIRVMRQQLSTKVFHANFQLMIERSKLEKNNSRTFTQK